MMKIIKFNLLFYLHFFYFCISIWCDATVPEKLIFFLPKAKLNSQNKLRICADRVNYKTQFVQHRYSCIISIPGSIKGVLGFNPGCIPYILRLKGRYTQRKKGVWNTNWGKFPYTLN